MPTPKEGYFLLDGTKVPGTTTIIGRFKESGALIYWAWTQGKEGKDFRQTKQKAADAGTVAHDMVELHIHGKDPMAALRDVPEDLANLAKSAFGAYLSWSLQTKLKIISTEMQLVHEGLKFGGTPDAVGVINGDFVLLDWKTSNSVYSDYLIQLAAYKLLIEEGHFMDGDLCCDVKIKGFHLLRFAKEYGDFAHHYYSDLSDAEKQFRLFRQAYDIDKLLVKRTK